MKLLTPEEAVEITVHIQPSLRYVRLGQAVMDTLCLRGYKELYDHIVKEDDFFYEEDDEIALEKFINLCVQGDNNNYFSNKKY